MEQSALIGIAAISAAAAAVSAASVNDFYAVV